jgi:hypothetical protein
VVALRVLVAEAVAVAILQRGVQERLVKVLLVELAQLTVQLMHEAAVAAVLVR